MAAEDEVREIEEPIEHQDPGEEEMPAPSHRQVLIGRQRRPGGKATLFQRRRRRRVEAPSTPVVLKAWPKIVVTPAVAFPSSSCGGREREEGPLEIGRLPPGQQEGSR